MERALIHVGGPGGSDKTALVEAILAAVDGPLLAVRCARDDGLRRPRESSPRTHAELRRYLHAGAYVAAVFNFPDQMADPISFYETELMANYSEAVILEGDNPLDYADLEVFVAPVLGAGETLFVRRQQDAPRRTAPPARAVEHWAVSDRFVGIERAGLVVVNIRDQSDRASAERLVADVHRLRKDDAVFNDIIGWRGHRLPITAVVANLADQRDAGRKKALSRIRRTTRQRRIEANPAHV